MVTRYFKAIIYTNTAVPIRTAIMNIMNMNKQMDSAKVPFLLAIQELYCFSDGNNINNDLTHHRRSREPLNRYCIMYMYLWPWGWGWIALYCDDCEYLMECYTKFMVPTAGTWCLQLQWCHRRNEEGVNHPLQESKNHILERGSAVGEEKGWIYCMRGSKMQWGHGWLWLFGKQPHSSTPCSQAFFQNGKFNDGWEISPSLLLLR